MRWIRASVGPPLVAFALACSGFDVLNADVPWDCEPVAVPGAESAPPGAVFERCGPSTVMSYHDAQQQRSAEEPPAYYLGALLAESRRGLFTGALGVSREESPVTGDPRLSQQWFIEPGRAWTERFALEHERGFVGGWQGVRETNGRRDYHFVGCVVRSADQVDGCRPQVRERLLADLANQPSQPLALPGATLGAPGGIEVRVADRVWSEVRPGTSIALFASTGSRDHRQTDRLLPACVHVRGTAHTRAVVRVELDAEQESVLHDLPADAAVRVAICPSSASELSRGLPDGHVAMPLPASTPTAFARYFRPQDRVDVVAGLSQAGGLPPVTVTVGKDVELIRRDELLGNVALSLSADDAEMYAHLLDVAIVHLTLKAGPPEDPSTSTRMASILPPGMVIAAVPTPDRWGPSPFYAGGDLLDLVVSDGHTASPLLRRLLTVPAAGGLDDEHDSILGFTTPELAERWLHAATFASVTYALRHPDDFQEESRPAEGGRPADLLPTTPDTRRSARVPRGMLGLVMSHRGVSPRPGEAVALEGPGCPARVDVLDVAGPDDRGVTSVLVSLSAAQLLAVVEGAHSCEISPLDGGHGTSSSAR